VIAGKYELRASNPDMEVKVKGSTQVGYCACIQHFSCVHAHFMGVTFYCHDTFNELPYCAYYFSNIVFLAD